jgi:hypothetical protein
MPCLKNICHVIQKVLEVTDTLWTHGYDIISLFFFFCENHTIRNFTIHIHHLVQLGCTGFEAHGDCSS